MATVVPISNIIKFAKICQALSGADTTKKLALKGSDISPNLSRVLYMQRKALEWMYVFNPSDADLDKVANYVYSLCGKFLAQAKVLSGNAGGQIIINPTTGLPINFVPHRLQFVVQSGSPYMEPGDTQYTITDPDIQPSTVNITSDGLELGLGLTDRLSYNLTQVTGGYQVDFNSPTNDSQLLIFEWISIIQ